MPVMGASAACAGLMGLFAVRYYRARLAFVGLPFRPHVVYVVAVFLAMEIGLGLFAVLRGTVASGVAHWAHVGGFIFGAGIRPPAGAQRIRFESLPAGRRGPGDGQQRAWRRDPEMGTAAGPEPENPGIHEELARAWLLLGDGDMTVQHYLTAIALYLSKGGDRTSAAPVLRRCTRSACR